MDVEPSPPSVGDHELRCVLGPGGDERDVGPPVCSVVSGSAEGARSQQGDGGLGGAHVTETSRLQDLSVPGQDGQQRLL